MCTRVCFSFYSFWSSAKRVVRSLRNVGLSLGNLLWLPVPRQPAVPSRADVVQREYEKQIAQLTDRQRVRPQTLAYDRYLSQSEGNTNGIVRHKLESTISEWYCDISQVLGDGKNQKSVQRSNWLLSS